MLSWHVGAQRKNGDGAVMRIKFDWKSEDSSQDDKKTNTSLMVNRVSLRQ